jgi:hypothetical protein
MPEIFRAIAWGRSNVLSETVARLRRTGTRYALGPAWYDVDRFSDVALLAAHLDQHLARMKMLSGSTSGPAPRREATPAASPVSRDRQSFAATWTDARGPLEYQRCARITGENRIIHRRR